MKPKTKSIMWTITLSLILSLAMAYPCAAGTVTTKSATQSGRSPIYHFDVVAYNGEVAGKVTVNTANAQLPSYVLVARGLTPNTKYTFGYTTTSEEVYPLWSMDSPKAGALVIKGNFPLDDVDDLQSAQFWVMETPPAAINALINGLYLGNYWGWFITKLACYYSTDGGVTWTESSHTGGIAMGENARVLLRDLGLPDGALVRMHAIVVGGKDRTGSEVFQHSWYSCGKDWSHRIAGYYIDGVTWKPVLTYKGLSDIMW
jgi:hypothetical protein